MNNPVLVAFLSLLLIAVLFIPVIRINKKKEYKSIYLSLYVLFLVFLTRFLVAINAEETHQIVGLNTFERLMDSIVHTLQTFSIPKGNKIEVYLLASAEELYDYLALQIVDGMLREVFRGYHKTKNSALKRACPDAASSFH